MEVIRLAGYTQNEKVEIARRHLIPKQLEGHGLDPEGVHFSTEALKAMIERYTDEAGLRNLERLLARVSRKVARSVAEGKDGPSRVSVSALEKYLGVPRKLGARALHSPRVGVSTGLAVTPTGGDVLFVEALIMPGTGQLILTGHLGDVMKESARAALSFARARSEELGIEKGAFDGRDIHLHVPEGAIPKDGPSAGVTLAAALVSALTRRPVRSELAMTGEITLRGTLLPVGGIREKLLAARRAGLSRVLIPEENRKDLKDVPHTSMGNMKVVCARGLDEVMQQALLEPEPPQPDDHPSDIPARPEGVAVPTGVGSPPSRE
jgi:ATP-dependent Lon protease